MKKTIQVSGSRKRAVARASLSTGKGTVRVNSKKLEIYEPEMQRMKIMEPLLIAGDVAKKLDIDVKVNGGGFNAQAEAIRVAIARALVAHDKKLERPFQDYDRQLLVADVRRKEASKPNRHGKARAKRQKSYR